MALHAATPGDAGCGAVILDESGNVVRELSRYLGHTTINVAEYEGLLMGLEALLQLGKKRIRVQSDSQLLVRQLNGEYRVKDEKLKILFKRPSRYCVSLRRIVSCTCLGN